MNIDRQLDSDLAGLRSALHDVAAPPALEAALAAHYRRQHRPSRPRLWWMPPLALLATAAIVSWMIRAPGPQGSTPVMNPAAAPVMAVPDADGGPFLALKPLERIALEPGTTVVTSEFPRALLADWGLPVAPDRAAEPVRAETLYSADGEALAIRLVQ